jgi:putative hydrolases of HD superfamily
MKISYAQTLTELVELIKGYSNTLRGNPQPYTFQRLAQKYDLEYDWREETYRETLLEHTGSLPVITTFLYPYIGIELDIGKVLLMLSFHDIGELREGDIITFLKKPEDGKKEKQFTLETLNPIYHSIYLEFEAMETNEARFAKSIDKLAPDVYDYIWSEATVARLTERLGITKSEVVPKLREFKTKYMLWNEFLTGFHNEIMAGVEKQITKK